jgi:hypothetical protein
MDQNDLPITFLKGKDVLNYIITLYSTLGKKEDEKEIIFKRGGGYFREKSPEEIIKIQANSKELHDKILSWIGNRSSSQLALSIEESSLFRECSHAAYYFITESENLSPAQKGFAQYHKMVFSLG